MNFVDDFSGANPDRDMRSAYPKIAPVDFGSPGTSLTQNVRKIAAAYVQGKELERSSSVLEAKNRLYPTALPPDKALTLSKLGQSNRTSYYDKTDYSLNPGASDLASPYFVNIEDISNQKDKAKNPINQRKRISHNEPSRMNVSSERGLVGWLSFVLEKRPFLGLDVAAETLSFSLINMLIELKSNNSEYKRPALRNPNKPAKDNNEAPNPCYPTNNIFDHKVDLKFLRRQEKHFNSMKEELLKEHKGYFVLFCDGKVIDRNKDRKKLLSLAYKKYGAKPYFIDFVGDGPKEEEPTIYTPFE